MSATRLTEAEVTRQLRAISHGAVIHVRYIEDGALCDKYAPLINRTLAHSVMVGALPILKSDITSIEVFVDDAWNFDRLLADAAVRLVCAQRRLERAREAGKKKDVRMHRQDVRLAQNLVDGLVDRHPRKGREC